MINYKPWKVFKSQRNIKNDDRNTQPNRTINRNVDSDKKLCKPLKPAI